MYYEKDPEILVDMLEDFILLRKPATSFKECFTSYTKDKMVMIAEESHLKVRRSKSKAIVAEDFFNELSRKSYYELTYQHPENMALLKELMKGPKEIELASFAKEHPFVFDLVLFGWIYLFKDMSNSMTHTIVLPNETAELVKTVTNNPNFKQKHKKTSLLQDYLDAFLNLYGAFDFDFFLTTWNKQNKQFQLNKDDFIVEILNLIWFNNRVGINKIDGVKYFYNRSSISESDSAYILRTSSNHDYYQPTKADIQYYARNEYDTRTPYYQQMKKYFSKTVKADRLDDVMDLMVSNFTLDLPFQELADDLNELFGIRFTSIEDLNQFGQLYSDLNNHTRKWLNRGNTPNELSMRRPPRQFPIPKNPASSHIPKANEPIRAGKIGRNDPCPCGSGKKYKHCHGK